MTERKNEFEYCITDEKKRMSPEVKEEKTRLPLIQKLAFSVGNVLNDLTGAMFLSYIVVVFQQIKQFDESMAGHPMVVSSITSAVVLPVIGTFSDRLNVCLRFGRRKTWHLMGTCLNLVSFPILFVETIEATEASKLGQIMYFIVFSILYGGIGWSAVHVCHLSLINDISTSVSERVQLNSLRNASTVMSGLMVYLIAWLLFFLHKSDNDKRELSKDDQNVFRDLTIIILCIGSLCSVIFYIFTKEPYANKKIKHKMEENTQEELSLTGGNITESEVVAGIQQLKWYEWFKEHRYYQVATIYTCTGLIVKIPQMYMPIYVTDSLYMDKTSVAIVPLIVYISGLIASLLMRIANKKFGRKKTLMFGQLCIISACVWIYFITNDTTKQIYGASILVGCGGATGLVTAQSMISDLVHTDVESGGFVYGSMACMEKLLSGASVFIIQQLNPCSNSSSTENGSCTAYYRNILVAVPAGFTVLAFVVILSLIPYKLSDRGQQGNREFVITADGEYSAESTVAERIT